jgi:hypothetical protein
MGWEKIQKGPGTINIEYPALDTRPGHGAEPVAAGHGLGTRFGFFPRAPHRRPAATGSEAALNQALL